MGMANENENSSGFQGVDTSDSRLASPDASASFFPGSFSPASYIFFSSDQIKVHVS